MKRIYCFETLVSITVVMCLSLSACAPGLLTASQEKTPTGDGQKERAPAGKEESFPETGEEVNPDATVISGTGDIRGKTDEFRALLGADNDGEPVGKEAGRREVNWDGIPDDLAAPADYLGDFFSVSIAPRARGIFMVTSGKNFMVSADSDNPSGAAVRFGNLNPRYPQTFRAFSEERLFAPMGSNVFDVGFFVPGTTKPALVKGFGAVFADVDGNETFIELFNQKSESLGRYTVPPADNDLSFLGVALPDAEIYRVRVKLGNTPLGPDDGDGFDVVAMDDFIYGEPQALTGAVLGKIEPPKSGSAVREIAASTETITQTATTTETVNVSVAETPTATVRAEEFLLNFDDAGDNHLAALSVDLTGLEPAPEGHEYLVWLMDYSKNYTLVGEAIPGQIFIYTDPGGKNLIGRFRGAALSLEDAEAVQANTVKTPTDIRYSGEIPTEILPFIQKLVVAAPDTPGQTAYGHGLQEQTAIAIHHAEVLLESLQGNDLPAAKQHLEHLWNTLVGFHSPDYGDLNGDGRAENYGDGFGALLYASRLVGILDKITELQNVNDHYRQGAANAARCARVVANILAPEVKDKGRQIFAAQDASSVISAGEVVQSAVETMAHGFDTDGNGTIDPAAGECGASQVYDLVRRLYHIHMTRANSGEHGH